MANVIYSYFGGCPQCGGNDGCANVGKTHLFYCSEHKTKWSPGSNLFSGWRDETEEDQRKRWEEIGLGDFDAVEPIFPKEPIPTNISIKTSEDLPF